MRILITGASGSGTTTLGKEISSIYGWNFIDADDYFWMPTNPPFTEKRSSDERLRLIMGQLNRSENSIISGSIMNWGAELEDSIDLIVFLYLDSEIRVGRVKEREILIRGQVDPDFLKWVSEYDTGPKEGRSLAKHESWLGQQKCEIVRIEGDYSVEERLEILTRSLPNK